MHLSQSEHELGLKKFLFSSLADLSNKIYSKFFPQMKEQTKLLILIRNILIPFLNQFWFQENFCCNLLQIQVPWIKNHNNALSLDLYFTFRFRMICLLKFEVLRVQSHSDSGWLDTTLILPPSPVNENLQDWKTKISKF